MSVIGSLIWAERSEGRLSSSERRSLYALMLKMMVPYAVGRLRLIMGLRQGAEFDLDTLVIPDSRIAVEAERECEERLSRAVLAHSHRTFVFAWALTKLDGVDVDIEHLYVTSLLHDIALESPSPHTCFAVAGGRVMRDLAQRVGCDDATCDYLAESITAHITPDIDRQRFPLAAALTEGALVDLVGNRLWELHPAFVREVLQRHPRDGSTIARAWKNEARTFPHGRAAAADRFSRFSLLVRLAPFSDKRSIKT